MKLFNSFFLITVFFSEQALCKDAMELRQRTDGKPNEKLPMAANARAGTKVEHVRRKLQTISNNSVDDPNDTNDDTTNDDTTTEDATTNDDTLSSPDDGNSTSTSFDDNSTSISFDDTTSLDSSDDAPDGFDSVSSLLASSASAAPKVLSAILSFFFMSFFFAGN